MKSKLLISATFSILTSFIYFNSEAQCLRESVASSNGSFEGVPGKGVAPQGWTACQSGQSPDIQPGSFAVTLAPADGISYAGLYFIDTIKHPNIGSWQEGLSQALPSAFKAGNKYHSAIQLANSSTTDSGLEPGCAELEIWGGYGHCDHQELLWHSGDISNYDFWMTYPIVINPSSDYTFITLQIKGLGCSGMPYILVDDLLPFSEEYRISVNLAASHDSVCKGQPVTLNAGASNDEGNIQFSWSHAASASSSLTIHPVTATVVKVTATDSAGCSSDTASVTIGVFSPLKLSYKIPDVCEGDSGTVRMHAAAGDGNYQFFVNGVAVTGNEYHFRSDNDTLYTIMLSDGCEMVTDSIFIKSNRRPVADFSYTHTGGMNFTFTDNSSVSQGVIRYRSWSFGDSESSSFPNPVHVYPNPGNYLVTLEVISDRGCRSLPFSMTIDAVKDTATDEPGSDTGRNGISGITEKETQVKFQSAIFLYSMNGSFIAEIKNQGTPVIEAIRNLPLPAGTYVYSGTGIDSKGVSGKITIIQ